MSAYKFSGHQTFVFRHGWLEKGVALIRENPRGFLEADAIVKLGVGKNMVESIRYWCTQTGLLEDGDELGTLRLTRLAKFIFGENSEEEGADPYLEDEGTLWLLHYNLVVNQKTETTWSIVFNNLNKPEFSKSDLLAFIQRRLDDKVSISGKTLERDIDCFVRSYTGTRGKSGEDSFDCPFLALSLMQATGDSDFYRLSIGRKRNLPIEMLGYAVLNKLHEMSTVSGSVQAMLFEPHSPGQVFKLDENALVDGIMALQERSGDILSLVDSSGLNAIQYARNREHMLADAWKLLKRYYYGVAVS